MHEASLHEDVEATLKRLMVTHQGLEEQLDEAYGYAVFPSVGRAAVVIGVSAGDGEVFERGESIGFASLRQLTVGIQIGGQTFSELLLFDTKEALEQFKSSPTTFTANASAVLVKAAATGTTDFGGITARAFADGGELLELSLGGQKFHFQPPGTVVAQERTKGEPGERIKDLASKVAAKLRIVPKEAPRREESGRSPHPPAP